MKKLLFLGTALMSLSIFPMLTPRSATNIQEELARCTIKNECLDDLTDISAQAMKGMTFSASRAHELAQTQRALIDTQRRLLETSDTAAKSTAQVAVAHPFSPAAIKTAVLWQVQGIAVTKGVEWAQKLVSSFVQKKIQSEQK
ncbi:MAG: hypothetical protein WC747_03625 [Candidatus Babeliales bacterium]|jgi:hypothetical protein